MDLRNLIDNNEAEPGVSSSPATSKTGESHRFSIDSMMNSEPATLDRAEEIRQRNSIVNLTNAQDVEIKSPKNGSKASSSPFAVPKGRGLSVSPQTKTPKPHTLDEELDSLKLISTDEKPTGKPRRYKSKPKWAQDYVPKHANSNTRSKLRNLNTSLEALSITNSIPFDDFTMTVTNWIYANIAKVKEDHADNPEVPGQIELELKLGQLWDRKEDRKLVLPVLCETIVSREFFNERCAFRSGITPEQHRDAKEFLDKLVESNARNSKRKFFVQRSHDIDKHALETIRNQKPQNIRVSFDYKTKRLSASIHKRKLSDLFMYFPNSLFDVRLSMSIEEPVDLNADALESFNKKVQFQREKDRVSYVHNATFSRIDLTRITEAHGHDKPIKKHELEIEINTPELLRSIDILPQDSLYYVDLVKTFLDNGRILARKLTEGPQI